MPARMARGTGGLVSMIEEVGPYSRAVVLCRPDPWGRFSFAVTPLSILGWIYDPDHSLPPGMYVDVPHLDCLLVAALITVEGLDQLILKPKQLDGITAVYVDVVVGRAAGLGRALA